MLLSLCLAFLGAILASFAGVIAERLNTGESWTHGRSRCNSCARTLTALDLIPVLSWIFSSGRCRSCHAVVPYRYLLAELALAVLFFAGGQAFGYSLSLLFYLISVFLLAIIVLYDLRHTIVPLEFALLLVTSTILFALTTYSFPDQIKNIVFVAALTGLAFFTLHAVSKGKWMGLGDTPVALSLALLTGQQALAGLLFSFWIGGAVGVVILVLAPRGHKMGIEVPFVPFLAAGYLLALFTQWNPLPL